MEVCFFAVRLIRAHVNDLRLQPAVTQLVIASVIITAPDQPGCSRSICAAGLYHAGVEQIERGAGERSATEIERAAAAKSGIRVADQHVGGRKPAVRKIQLGCSRGVPKDDRIESGLAEFGEGG